MNVYGLHEGVYRVWCLSGYHTIWGLISIRGPLLHETSYRVGYTSNMRTGSPHLPMPCRVGDFITQTWPKYTPQGRVIVGM